MQELGTLEISQLVDLLAQHTSDYTRMQVTGTSEEEYAKCKLTLKAIQTEIDLRKKATTESNITIPPPEFS